jgi:hypothetical protein
MSSPMITMKIHYAAAVGIDPPDDKMPRFPNRLRRSAGLQPAPRD